MRGTGRAKNAEGSSVDDASATHFSYSFNPCLSLMDTSPSIKMVYES